MAKSREINMNLPSADDLFTTQEERDHKNQEYVKNISIYEITDFPNHPFKVKMDDKMLETIESVRDHGVLVPALVRENQTGGYEMISGHRRKMASELAGKETMPCIVRNLTVRKSICVTCRTLSFVWSYGDSGWSPGSNEPSVFHSVMWGQCKNCPYFFAVLRHGNRDLYFYQETLPTR